MGATDASGRGRSPGSACRRIDWDLPRLSPTVADGATTTHPDRGGGGGSRRNGLGPTEASLSLCGWLKGRIGLAGCPTGAEDNARPLKSGLGSGGVIRPYCPLLSQKVANPPASARRDGAKGSFGLAAATQPLAKRKKTHQRRQAGTPLFCIYDPILQLVDGNVKHQVASERVSRRTRVLRKNPGSGAVKSRSARDSLIRRKNSLMAPN